MKVEHLLRKYYGYNSFRTGQKEIIASATSGANTLGILPTGGGKSVCFQIPGLIRGGVTLVISPLISLMKDQVDTLNGMGLKAAYLNSQLKVAEVRAIEEDLQLGSYQFLYVAPERFGKQDFLRLLETLDIRLIAFDEAHCISKWGHDFRPSYRDVVKHIKRFNCPHMALTATATVDVKKDLQQLLSIDDAHTFQTSPERENLIFQVDKTYQREKKLKEYIKAHPKDSGIVYASTRKQVEALSESLDMEGIEHVIYHAGLRKELRDDNQAKFTSDDARVMIATNAFGMGIDKSNVRYVIHYNLPGDLESYYQEAGRAGRDGLDSDCILMFSEQDINLQQFFISGSDEAIQEMRKEKLDKMVQYTKTQQCLMGTIINYFNPAAHLKPCGRCSSCKQQGHYDMTIEAMKILSCLVRCKVPVKRSVLISILRGESSNFISKEHFDELPTFGILKDYKTKDLNGFIDTLFFSGYIIQQQGKLICHPSAKAVLKQEVTVMTHYKPVEYSEKVSIRTHAGMDETLFDMLRTVRKGIAEEKGVPPFTVFSDKTLTLFATKKPMTKQEMILIDGVGAYKLKHYCPLFIEAIENYQNASS